MRTFGRHITPHLVALLCVAGSLAGPALAQQPFGYVTLVDGTATVTRAGSPSPVTLQFRDPVFLGDRVTIEQASLVKMLLAGKALLTMGELSSLAIGEINGQISLTQDTGKVAVATARLRPGDAVEIRTSNAIAQVRGSLILVEALGAVTQIDCGAGNCRGGLLVGPLVEIPPRQGLTITGDAIGALRPIRPGVTSGLQSNTRASASRQLPLWAFAPGINPVVTLPSVWTLLIDGGKGFEPWVGTPSEGYVAGDGSCENVTLAVCGTVAKMLAEKGAQVVCAHLPPREESFRYRSSPQGRLMAKGPLAGRMVVYESVTEAADWTLRSMMIDPRGFWLLGSDSSTPGLASNMELAVCEAAAQRYAESGLWAACVRLPRDDLEYRDAQGHLMADGPFAGGLLIYDPNQGPLIGVPSMPGASPFASGARVAPGARLPSTPGPAVQQCPYDNWMSTGCKAGERLK